MVTFINVILTALKSTVELYLPTWAEEELVDFVAYVLKNCVVIIYSAESNIHFNYNSILGHECN